MKALVVDDDPTSCFYLREILTPYAEVRIALDGAAAVRAFQEAVAEGNPYQLVCLDIMMPDTNGVQALQLIRQAEERISRLQTPPVKILMTTAMDDSRTVVNAFREQCDGYLVKPINKGKFLDSLRSLALIA